MPLEGLQLGRYRLLRLLGSGGMGEVYLAEDTLINRQVAIKVIRAETTSYPDADATKEAARLFQREMKTISHLDHPHILPLFDYGEEKVNDMPLTFLVMPYRQEGSLATWLQQRGKVGLLSPQQVAHFIDQAADALQHAHDRQIIHQDVKPANFLTRSNQKNPGMPDLLLADFGVAKFSSATATASQAIRGTPAYMAPEQWEGNPVAATDQYALAVMAYDLLTGRPPFQGGLGTIMFQHFNSQPQPPSTLNPRLPAGVDAVLLRALAKKPENRFSSIADFAQVLEQALQGKEAASGTPARSESEDTLARNAPSGADIRATLAISKSEALTGTSRTLTLPGGRRMTIAVPAGTEDGQVIYLGGQGEPSSSGGPTGSLILTIAVKPEEASAIPDAESARETVRASNPSLQRPSVPTSITNLPTPVVLPANANLVGQGPSVAYTRNGKNAASTLLKSRKGLLIGLAFLVVVGILGGVFYFRSFNYFQRSVLLNAGPKNPYGASGTIALNDPLSDNSNGYFWDMVGSSYGSCDFTGGAYEAVSIPGNVIYCPASNTNFSNLAYEVRMTIIKGDCGGLYFRGDGSRVIYYYFIVCQDGSYSLGLYMDNTHAMTLLDSNSPAIHTQLNQFNTIAVVAIGSMINLYVNQQKIDSTSDSTYSHGQVGVVAYANSNQTEVVFSNAKVWML